MAVFVNDTFSGEVDGANLTAHTGETGATWSGTAAVLMTAAGDVHIASASRQLVVASGAPASAEYDIAVDVIYYSTAGTFQGVAARSGAGNYYFASVWNTSIRIFKTVGATDTQLGSYSVSVTADTSVVFEIRDAAKKMYLAGVERISTADNSITAAGSVGFTGSGAVTASTGFHFDNFTATDASAGAASLTVAGAAHAHTAGAPSLTQANALAVAGSAHAHGAGSPSLTQANTLAVAGSGHATAAGSPALTQAAILAIAAAAHGHTAGSPALTQAHSLAADSASHAHAAGSPVLGEVSTTLTTSSAAHAHTVASPTLTQAGSLTVQGAVHATGAGLVTFVSLYAPPFCGDLDIFASLDGTLNVETTLSGDLHIEVCS